jgi:hypothetical protein
MPRNLNSRRKIFREARLGLETARSFSAVDALTTINSVVAIKDAVDRAKTTIPFFAAVLNAWAARKDWRP